MGVTVAGVVLAANMGAVAVSAQPWLQLNPLMAGVHLYGIDAVPADASESANDRANGTLPDAVPVLGSIHGDRPRRSGAAQLASAEGNEEVVAGIVALLPNDMHPSVPIRVVNPRDMGKTSDPGAFTLDGDLTIYLSNQTVAFDLARTGDGYARAVLASCLWHEEQHVRGLGESQAYEAQIGLVTLFVRTSQMDSKRGEGLLGTLRDLRSRASQR